MVFIDTPFLVALALPRDALHGRARAWAYAITGKLITHDLVLYECHAALLRTGDQDKASAILDWLRHDCEVVIYQPSDRCFLAGLDMCGKRADESAFMADWVSASLLAEHSITQALSLDVPFGNGRVEALLRRDPPA